MIDSDSYLFSNMNMQTCVKKPKKKPTKIEEMTKEQIREAIIKKKECNAKAQNIVESLLEQSITEDYLLRCLPDINQSHFEDIIEERSIIHLCGYPICPKSLSKRDIPKQKYRISVKNNKVYDITGRKNFCSNTCYRAAMYVKNLLLTSPLWFREYEEIPSFHLLPLDATGSMGQEVDLGSVERVKIKPDKPFISINDFTSASLSEITGNNDDGVDMNSAKPKLNSADEKVIEECRKDSTDNSNTLKLNHDNLISTQPVLTETKKHDKIKKSTPNPFNIVGDIIEKTEKKIDPILSNKPENKTSKLPQKKPPLVTALTIEVEKCLAEWFTLDTVLFLFGEEKVKEMVADKGDCIKEYLNNYAKGIFYKSNAYDQYQALCKKLNMLELEDRRYDAQAFQRETKPLPNYSCLQEESKKMQLKVNAFLAGETEIPECDISDNRSIPIEDENRTQLPLVDKNAQNALRRKIVCQHLNKVLPDLLRSLGLLTLSINSEVRLLVNTFKLKANNIMFKPIQWTLIAIVVIKLLSLREKRLEYLMELPMAFQHMQLLLLSYKQDGGYLDRLISWLTDIDRLLDTNDTQLTLE